ncbi:MAG: arginase family protein [bacterium]|nr:arginase family protein [bacterium]
MLLQVIKPHNLGDYYSGRWNETKLGEVIKTLPGGKFTAASLTEAHKVGARYAILGIPEDIGPRANGGRAGASEAWPAFLKYFLSEQSNSFLSGENILLVGNIVCEDLQKDSHKIPDSTDEQNYLRALCSRLDERVFPVVAALVAYGYMPIVIGGGHNNAYPIIKGVAYGLSLASLSGLMLEEHPLMQLAFGNNDSAVGESLEKRPLVTKTTARDLALALSDITIGAAKNEEVSINDIVCDEEISLAEAVRRHLQKSDDSAQISEGTGTLDIGGQPYLPISVVNCDSHADFRALEGRHSGNPFSYAKLAHYLNNYYLVNYQENSNSATMLSYMRALGIRAFSYESIFVRREFTYADTLSFVVQLLNNVHEPIGLELDLDTIAMMPSSARSPQGISLDDAAFYLHRLSSSLPAIYCHLPEGAPSLGEDGERTVGRSLTLLVNTVIKGCEMYRNGKQAAAN